MRAHHGLERRGQVVRTIPAASGLLASTHLQILTQPETARNPGQSVALNEARSTRCEHPFRPRIVCREKLGSDGRADYRVAQKLQPFVRFGEYTGVLVQKRAVHEGLGQ